MNWKGRGCKVGRWQISHTPKGLSFGEYSKFTVAGVIWKQRPHNLSQQVCDVLYDPDDLKDSPENWSCDVTVAHPDDQKALQAKTSLENTVQLTIA